MKTAQCKYVQAGVEINLTLYFDIKAFDFITPIMNNTQEEEFIHLTCDSMATALPRENTEKYFYIKRIYKSSDAKHLHILCTDGFLIDEALSILITPQAYANERIKLN